MITKTPNSRNAVYDTVLSNIHTLLNQKNALINEQTQIKFEQFVFN